MAGKPRRHEVKQGGLIITGGRDGQGSFDLLLIDPLKKRQKTLVSIFDGQGRTDRGRCVQMPQGAL